MTVYHIIRHRKKQGVHYWTCEHCNYHSEMGGSLSFTVKDPGAAGVIHVPGCGPAPGNIADKEGWMARR